MIFKLLISVLLAGSLAGPQAPSITNLYRKFVTPPRANSLMPYWYWNGRIKPAETHHQIRAMIDQGVYQAVVFPWDGMELGYPGMRDRVLTEQMQTREHINIFVGYESIRYSGGC